MVTFKVTLVPATYVQVTSYISNISAITAPILTKIFAPNILGGLIFVRYILLDQTFFDPNTFLTQKCFGPNCFFHPECFGPKFFIPKIFGSKIFGLKINLNPNLWTEFFWTQNFFTQILYLPSM